MRAGAEAGTRAVVLGGGGVTGVAWETGILFGLAEAGIDLTRADLFVGTSAGSVVAAQMANGLTLGELFTVQTKPPMNERAAHLGSMVVARYALAALLPGDARAKRARLGRAALRARTVPEEERRQAIAAHVPYQAWPERKLLVTAVDAESGASTIFDKASGVALLDAVAASCAVPLVWPPMTVKGRRYMDGGIRSIANVDLAAGYERVVVIAPIVFSFHRRGRPDIQAAALGTRVRSIVISPDAAAVEAIGRNMLDSARRVHSAQAGRAQAVAVAEAVRAVWD